MTVWVTWALFALDYVARLVLAEHRGRYFIRHLLDLAIIALPLLRPLRLLRLASLLKVMNRKASTGLRGKVAIYVVGGSAMLAFCGALAVLDAERANPDRNIVSFGDAMWWAITTMTTVGYGDHYPTTGIGRLAAAALMVGGITLLGVVTATIRLLADRAGSDHRAGGDRRSEVGDRGAPPRWTLCWPVTVGRSTRRADPPQTSPTVMNCYHKIADVGPDRWTATR